MTKSSFLAAVLLNMVFQLAGPSATAAEPIVVGRSLALSGPLKSYGEAKRDGGDAYLPRSMHRAA